MPPCASAALCSVLELRSSDTGVLVMTPKMSQCVKKKKKKKEEKLLKVMTQTDVASHPAVIPPCSFQHSRRNEWREIELKA